MKSAPPGADFFHPASPRFQHFSNIFRPFLRPPWPAAFPPFACHFLRQTGLQKFSNQFISGRFHGG
jgi:hypothetical protein